MQAVFEARLFDGLSAQAQRVLVTREGEWLRVGDGTVAIDDLRRVSTVQGVTLHRIDAPDWRLMVPSDAGDSFSDLKKLHSVTGRQVRWVTGSVAAVAALGAFFWFAGSTILQTLAPLVPRDISRSVGEQYIAMFAPVEKRCTAPAGRAALDTIIARITPPGGLVEPVTVNVADDSTINAFALPGGQVILYRGLIAQAESPEEVAGVLAHEFGHVQRYHGNQALIRHFGAGIFLEGLGGDIGSVAATGLFLSNTRSAEREADEEAIRFLSGGKVSAAGVSAFFARLGGNPARGKPAEKGEAVDSGTDIVDLISTHPPDADRQRKFAEAARGYTATPLLNDAQWQALKAICGS
jgi:beta-barrel assembly-enhancing protease